MGNSDIHYTKLQEGRGGRFPSDRIPFLKGNERVANEDRHVFVLYKHGEISLAMACFRIANNNYLDNVTREQFLNEYKICGYEGQRDE